MSDTAIAAPGMRAYSAPAVNPWIIALVVTMATFMEVLDTSIANVSLPHIAGGLSAGVDESTWILTSYLVSNAIILPMSGWFSNLIGRKRFYMSCVAVFTISSFLCGLAPNLGALIVFRVLQGLGGGGLQPSEQAILADTFPPAKRGMAFAIYGMAVVVAPAIGPTLGGFITDNYSWRWIFYINVPIGIISLLLTSRLISDPPHLNEARKRSFSIDYIGLGLLALGLGALQVVLDKGQRDDWFDSHFIVILTTIAAAALVTVIFWEWHHDHPIIDLRLFRDRSFATANGLMFIAGVCAVGHDPADPAVRADAHGLSRGAGGAGADAGRLADHCAAAAGGADAGANRSAKDDGLWIVLAGHVDVLHDALRSGTRFRDRCVCPADPGRRHGFLVGADQHRGVFLSAARKE